MITNNIILKIKTALKLNDSDTLKAYELAKFPLSELELENILKNEEDEGFRPCGYEELGAFLDGLVILKRGPSPKKSNAKEVLELTNNLILKKLRIALELKEADIEIIFSLGDAELSKQQLSSLFRKDGHKNFKLCSDELLLAFLDGLDEYYYSGEEI